MNIYFLSDKITEVRYKRRHRPSWEETASIYFCNTVELLPSSGSWNKDMSALHNEILLLVSVKNVFRFRIS